MQKTTYVPLVEHIYKRIHLLTLV